MTLQKSSQPKYLKATRWRVSDLDAHDANISLQL